MDADEASDERATSGEYAETTEPEVGTNEPGSTNTSPDRKSSKYYDWVPFDVPPVRDHFGPPQFSKR